MYDSSFFRTSFTFIIICIIFIILCFSSTLSVVSVSNDFPISHGNIIFPENVILHFSNASFIWPTPGFTTITSPFGYRSAPTSGASSYHSGIDIGAPERNKYSSCIFWNCNLYWL